MSEFTDPRLQTLDGFRVEIDPARERADIILDRPPLNVIEMGQRDQLRLIFEALDEDARVRVIVLRATGAHFSSGGNIAGFLAASPEHVSKLAWNIAAPARCSKPVIVANRRLLFRRRLRDFAGLRFSPGFGDLLLCAAGAAARPNSGLGRLGAVAKDHRHHPHQRHRDAVETHSGQAGLRLGHRHRMRRRRQLEAATDALVEELRGFSPLAQRTAKTLLNETEDTNLEAAIELEGHCYARLRQSDDFREGVEAFHAKRKAVFRGS